MLNALVFLATGFEETEAIGVVDVLRRGQINARTVSITGEKIVVGAHNVPIVADFLIEEAPLEDAVALILPGGMPGSLNLKDSKILLDALRKQNSEGRIVAAICAAPMVLGSLGILKDKKVTCYPNFEDYLGGGIATGADVEVDGNIITGKGPGMVFKFGLAIAEAIKGKVLARELAIGLLLEKPSK